MDNTYKFPESKPVCPVCFKSSLFPSCKDGSIVYPKKGCWVEHNGKVYKLLGIAWTDWISCDDYEFKTNYKTVKVRKDGFKTKATCHKDDDFDINEGIKICLERITEKERRNI